MRAVPLELKEANAFVFKHHRHHKPVRRDKFRLGCEEGGELIGIIQVGNPVSRLLCDGHTLEVVRCCTNGAPNVCSFLYSRAARVAKELGYSKIITYILESESGISLKASGWKLEADHCGGGTWDRPNRKREQTQITLFGEEEKYPMVEKQRWVKEL